MNVVDVARLHHGFYSQATLDLCFLTFMIVSIVIPLMKRRFLLKGRPRIAASRSMKQSIQVHCTKTMPEK
jgi:hypothetical protein